MCRTAVLALAAIVGLTLAGCTSAPFGPPGVALTGASDGVQTLADAADSLDQHRPTASDSAKAAIGATDALGSYVREITKEERLLTGARRLTHPRTNLVSGTQFVLQPGTENVIDFCQSAAGYSVTGIPSLDETFGWQSGALFGGTRTAGIRGFATWSATASGEAMEGPIGALSVGRHAVDATCPMTSQPYTLDGAQSGNAFSIPVTLTFRHGALWSLIVANAKFDDGQTLDVATVLNHGVPNVSGTIGDNGVALATFRANGAGDGRLTITSSGAQYVISDWVVTGI